MTKTTSISVVIVALFLLATPPLSYAQTPTFEVGDRVQTTARLVVRDAAGGTRLGAQRLAAQGTVVSGPVERGAHTWWQIDWDTGADGWSAGAYLVLAGPAQQAGEPSITITSPEDRQSFARGETIHFSWVTTGALPGWIVQPGRNSVGVDLTITSFDLTVPPEFPLGETRLLFRLFDASRVEKARDSVSYFVTAAGEPYATIDRVSFTTTTPSPTITGTAGNFVAPLVVSFQGPQEKPGNLQKRGTGNPQVVNGRWTFPLPSSVLPLEVGEYEAFVGDSAPAFPLRKFVTFTVTSGDPPPTDTTPPTVSLTSPASGTTVSGTVTLSADASDNVGVRFVRFAVNSLGIERTVFESETTAPYQMTWDTTAGMPDCAYVVRAIARDAAGNRATSTTRAVLVQNGAARFATGDRVQTTDHLAVRDAADGTRLGAQKLGAQGTITGGPVPYRQHTWWQIDWDTGVDGWSVDAYLQKAAVAGMESISQIANALTALEQALKRILDQLER